MTKARPQDMWSNRRGVQRVFAQIPNSHTYTWEADPFGDWRVLTESLDGATYDYVYDPNNGCLLSRTLRVTS